MRSVYAYTDGCNNPQFVGSGAWLSERPSTRVPVHKISIATPNDGTNNIKGELVAVMEALKWAWENKYQIVVVVTDLLGIPNWGDGKWKRKTPITVEYYQAVKCYREAGMDIRFVWTKGHLSSGRHSFGNNMADQLAARALGK